MNLQQLYELAIDMGIKADPRGTDGVKRLLERVKKESGELTEKKKKFFDRENLTNPYSDSRILNGDPKLEVKKVMADETNISFEKFMREETDDAEILIPEIGKSADLKITNNATLDAFKKNVEKMYKEFIMLQLGH